MTTGTLIGMAIALAGWLVIFFVLSYQGMPSLETGRIPNAWALPDELRLLPSDGCLGTLAWLVLGGALILFGNARTATASGGYAIGDVWVSLLFNRGQLVHFPPGITVGWFASKLVFLASAVWVMKNIRIDAMEKNVHGTHVALTSHQAHVLRTGQFVVMTVMAALLGAVDGTLSVPILPCIAPSLPSWLDFLGVPDYQCTLFTYLLSLLK